MEMSAAEKLAENDISEATRALVMQSILDPSRASAPNQNGEVIVKLVTPAERHTIEGASGGYLAAKKAVLEAVPTSDVIGWDLDEGSSMRIKAQELEQVRTHIQATADLPRAGGGASRAG